MEVLNIYARKAIYGGIHIIAESKEYFPVGTRFMLSGLDGRRIFVVKKVSMDDTRLDDYRVACVYGQAQDVTLVYQLVDNGDSEISVMQLDIRKFLGATLELYQEPVRTQDESDSNEDDAEDDKKDKIDDENLGDDFVD